MLAGGVWQICGISIIERTKNGLCADETDASRSPEPFDVADFKLHGVVSFLLQDDA
jgi:hypothetical protein